MSWDYLVIARADEAQALVAAQPDDARWEWVSIEQNGTTLSLLAAAVSSDKPVDDDAIANIVWSPPLATAGEEGPWVYRLPPELLACSADGQLARRWGAAPLMEHFSDRVLSEFLTSLRTARQRAEQNQRELLYWASA